MLPEKDPRTNRQKRTEKKANNENTVTASFAIQDQRNQTQPADQP
jgi:hypothetical protein